MAEFKGSLHNEHRNMKTIIKLFFLSLIFLSNSINAQNLYSEEYFKEYFIKNISSLDPIEGIWYEDLNCKVLDKYNRLEYAYPHKEQSSKMAIMRVGDQFIEYDIVQSTSINAWQK